MRLPRRDYRTLDALVVVGTLVLVAGSCVALVFVRIPEANLPILSSVVSALIGGVLGLYAGARWGNKKADVDPPTA